jgi:fructose-specific phosphotransferase system IIC component
LIVNIFYVTLLWSGLIAGGIVGYHKADPTDKFDRTLVTLVGALFGALIAGVFIVLLQTTIDLLRS